MFSNEKRPSLVLQKSLMISVLRHQKMALAWMLKREMGSTPRGGILADDQGLGKTVSTMSLIVSNMPDPTTRGVRPSQVGVECEAVWVTHLTTQVSTSLEDW